MNLSGSNSAFIKRMVVVLCTGLVFLSAAAVPYCRVNYTPSAPHGDAWTRAVEISGFTCPLDQDYAKEPTFVKTLHDGKKLYIQICSDQEAKVTGSKQRDDRQIYKNNSVELFFAASDGDVRQIIVNSEGSVADILHNKDKLDWNWNAVTVTGAKKATTTPDRTGSWEVELTIPLNELPFDKNGNVKFNVVRNNIALKEYSTWASLPKVKWLQPEKFGTLVLAASQAASCGVSFVRLPQLKPGDKVTLATVADAPVALQIGVSRDARNDRQVFTVEKGRGEIDWQLPNHSVSSKSLITVEIAGNKVYENQYAPMEPFIEIFGLPRYTISSVPEMPTQIYWNQLHNITPIASPAGQMVNESYDICCDVPDGITVIGAVKKGASSYGKNRSVQCVAMKKAYSSPGWVVTSLISSLPDGSEGTVYYWINWKNRSQQPEKFTFRTYSFSPVKPPKNIFVGFYNYYVSNLAAAEKVRKFGINTIQHSGYNVKQVRELLAHGFYVIRGGYFFPDNNEGYIRWPQIDRTARALDIDGNTIFGRKGPQFSPSYRGKYFVEAVQKERKFVEETGLNFFAFDMEGYIMPNASEACFRPETISRFNTWFAQKFPDKKYLSPFVFEREKEKYPDYHDAWISFKDYIFADFFTEFKKQIGPVPGKGAMPWSELSLSEWSFPMLSSREEINKTMRGPEFLKAIGTFEISAYSSADRSAREVMIRLDRLNKLYPDLNLRLIFCPSPERLGVDNPKDYYYSPAPVLEDELKYMIYDAMAMGIVGIDIWKYSMMTALSWKNLTEAIRTINTIEDIVCGGKYIPNLSCTQPFGLVKEVGLFNRKELLSNQPKVLVKGIRNRNQLLIAVSEYLDLKKGDVTVTVPVRAPAEVFDAETGEKMATVSPEKNLFTVTLDKRRCRLFKLVENP